MDKSATTKKMWKNVQKVFTDILSKYFDGDIKKAEDANDFILNSREETVKESISRNSKRIILKPT